MIHRIRFDGMVNIIKDEIKGVDNDDILTESIREYRAGTLFNVGDKNA